MSESVRDLNDRLAREHSIDDYYAEAFFVVRWIESERLRIIRSMVAAEPGHREIEVGSGGGHVLRQFPQARLTAVDVSEVYLDTARKNLLCLDVEFHLGELEKLALPAASYDRIICT
jgi:ubiquinone/menaquinone biosynthesis C-methylase UbiE